MPKIELPDPDDEQTPVLLPNQLPYNWLNDGERAFWLAMYSVTLADLAASTHRLTQYDLDLAVYRTNMALNNYRRIVEDIR